MTWRAELFDGAVIGGGIVGMATAMTLLGFEAPGLPRSDTPVARLGSLVVLEAEGALGEHQTGRNSGVIHAGLYYKPGSLKATLCASGRRAMVAFCRERGIRHETCGKLVVATEAREVPELDELQRRGRANGLTMIRRLSPEGIREVEPHCRGIDGLFVGETGIVDYREVVRSYAGVVGERGGVVRLAEPLAGVRAEGDRFILSTPTREIGVRCVVNCAGLQCDRVARMFGVDPKLRIVPFRGEYYDLKPDQRHLVRNLIYPVRDPRFPFLGVHYTRAVDGTVEAGPNAVLALARHGYDWSIVEPADVRAMLAFPGFWRMARQHWRMGLMETRRSLCRAEFVRAMQRLVPAVTSEGVVPGRAGVRAQAVEASGALVDDFRIIEGPGQVHVLNAPSPAATASLAIARAIAERAHRVFAERKPIVVGVG